MYPPPYISHLSTLTLQTAVTQLPLQDQATMLQPSVSLPARQLRVSLVLGLQHAETGRGAQEMMEGNFHCKLQMFDAIP